MSIVSLASFHDYYDIIDFIIKYWKNKHIFTYNKELFDFQHKTINGYNFIISRSDTNEINGILGFIPNSQYDDEITTLQIWLALWKINTEKSTPGLGFLLIKYLEDNFNSNAITVNGVNNSVINLYKLMGYKTGFLNHFYFTNPFFIDFKICKNILRNEIYFTNNTHTIKQISITEFSDFDFSFQPFKSYKYIVNRFEKHPFYNYLYYGLFSDNNLDLILVIRKIYVGKSNCLKIVDVYGNYINIKYLNGLLNKIVTDNNSEYIDCINFGISKIYFLDAGFQIKDDKTIIPTFFEPFIQENHQINFAHKSTSNDFVIFQADGDQDRPNLINVTTNE